MEELVFNEGTSPEVLATKKEACNSEPEHYPDVALNIITKKVMQE